MMTDSFLFQNKRLLTACKRNPLGCSPTRKPLGAMLLATILFSKLWALKTEKITLTSHI